MNYKKDGFDGQKAIGIPRSIVNRFCLSNDIINPKRNFIFEKEPRGQNKIFLFIVWRERE
jgi:hypothetical protein